MSDPSLPHGDNLDVIARDTEVGTAFARFDLHFDSVECRLRGMITPSGGLQAVYREAFEIPASEPHG
jgi:hypothetical protein